MQVKIETYREYNYDGIKKEYGSVLNEFGLTKADNGDAYISVNCLEDLFKLDQILREFGDEHEDWCVYFGIVVEHYAGQPLLTIKDNYD